MLIFFDTEFTELSKSCELLSIGFVTEEGDQFYAEVTDYNPDNINPWVKENVIDNFFLKQEVSIISKDVFVKGTKEEISKVLRHWLEQYNSVQLVSDVCHYDMVNFIDLFGNAFQIPENVSPYCHDINQDLAKHLGFSDNDMFNISREELLEDVELPAGIKHNALYDAQVIKALWEYSRFSIYKDTL